MGQSDDNRATLFQVRSQNESTNVSDPTLCVDKQAQGGDYAVFYLVHTIGAARHEASLSPLSGLSW